MGWVVNITPRPRFTPGERTPGTHCTGGWVGPRAGLDTEARGKIRCLCRGSNLGRPVCCQTLYWVSYYSSSKRIFPVTSVSRPALGPTQPPVQWVLGVLYPGVNGGDTFLWSVPEHFRKYKACKPWSLQYKLWPIWHLTCRS